LADKTGLQIQKESKELSIVPYNKVALLRTPSDKVWHKANAQSFQAK